MLILRGGRNSKDAFSRIDLFTCILAFGLVAILVLPTLATSHARNDRLRCFNNLRQIGNGLRHFALENDDWSPWYALAGEAGNFDEPGKHSLWFQYWWLRDFIKDPAILMDPGETRANARVARTWDLTSEGLQLYRNDAVAYVLALDSVTFIPKHVMAADRHLLDVGVGSCSTGVNATWLRIAPGELQVRWLNEVHGPFGNLALTDGSVIGVDSEGLRRALDVIPDGPPEVHVLSATW